MAQCLGMADRQEDDPLRRNSGFANTGSLYWAFGNYDLVILLARLMPRKLADTTSAFI